MTTWQTRTARRALGAVAVGAALTAGPGCGRNNGPSDYDKMIQEKTGAAGSLAAAGAKATEKQYPVGRAWVVSLQGLTITPDLLKQVKALGTVAELDLSKSTATDADLATMRELELHALLNRLDLSHTAVTGAGLAKLEGNLFLADLNLTGTKVTPAAVAEFKRARQSDPRAKVKNTNVRL